MATKDEIIMYQVCLKAASELTAARISRGDPAASEQFVIGLAQQFFRASEAFLDGLPEQK